MINNNQRSDGLKWNWCSIYHIASQHHATIIFIFPVYWVEGENSRVHNIKLLFFSLTGCSRLAPLPRQVTVISEISIQNTLRSLDWNWIKLLFNLLYSQHARLLLFWAVLSWGWVHNKILDKGIFIAADFLTILTHTGLYLIRIRYFMYRSIHLNFYDQVLRAGLDFCDSRCFNVYLIYT